MNTLKIKITFALIDNHNGCFVVQLNTSGI